MVKRQPSRRIVIKRELSRALSRAFKPGDFVHLRRKLGPLRCEVVGAEPGRVKVRSDWGNEYWISVKRLIEFEQIGTCRMNGRRNVTLGMTTGKAFEIIVQGSPGAVAVLLESMKFIEEIDPDDTFGKISVMLALDELGIYGPRVWMLYKDVCGSNIAVMIAMLRAVQLGIITESALLEQLREDRRPDLAVAPIVLQVKQRLPKFDPMNKAGIK